MCFVEALVFGIAFASVFIDMLSRSEARISLDEYTRSGATTT